MILKGDYRADVVVRSAACMDQRGDELNGEVVTVARVRVRTDDSMNWAVRSLLFFCKSAF